MVAYRAEVARRVNTGGARTGSATTSSAASRSFFASEERALFCTDVAATVAEIVAEIALAHGARLERTAIRR